jgi:Trk K+ transport system NAD-binding subunit
VADQRFVIAGLSRLTVRVARLLAGPGVEIVVLTRHEDGELAERLQGVARIERRQADREETLRRIDLPGATALLALDDEDLENLSVAVAAAVVAPDVPVVLRAFDPSLSDRLEGLNVRRAYSMSALSAPSFVAAAVSDQVVRTLRLGPEEVILLRVVLREGSPLVDRTAAEVKATWGCAVAALADAQGAWRPIGLSERLGGPGTQALIGGPLHQVLSLALANGRTFAEPSRRRLRGVFPSRGPRADRPRGATLLPLMAVFLLAFLLAAVVVFMVTLHKSPIDALYFSISTALGNSTLDQESEGLKVIGVLSMLAGGALLGVVFSYFAAVATAERLEQRMDRRAREMSGHAVVAGMGTIGYRVERLLFELGVPTVVVDREPDLRFAAATGDRTPTLTGDVRLPENLLRAGVERAACLFAVTADDLTNIEACLQARRFNPSIRTVARIFEEDLADRVGGAFGVDAPISSSGVAAVAFAGAATDEHAVRTFVVGDLEYVAFRFHPARDVPVAEVDDWRGRHVRLLAFRRGEGPVQPPSEVGHGLGPGDSAILAGPAESVQELELLSTAPPPAEAPSAEPPPAEAPSAGALAEPPPVPSASGSPPS